MPEEARHLITILKNCPDEQLEIGVLEFVRLLSPFLQSRIWFLRFVCLNKCLQVQIVIVRVAQEVVTHEVSDEHVVDNIAHVEQVDVAFIARPLVLANLLRFVLHRLKETEKRCVVMQSLIEMQEFGDSEEVRYQEAAFEELMDKLDTVVDESERHELREHAFVDLDVAGALGVEDGGLRHVEAVPRERQLQLSFARLLCALLESACLEERVQDRTVERLASLLAEVEHSDQLPVRQSLLQLAHPVRAIFAFLLLGLLRILAAIQLENMMLNLLHGFLIEPLRILMRPARTRKVSQVRTDGALKRGTKTKQAAS